MPAGGRRSNAGRKKGVPNKATREIKALAQEHGPKVIAMLARLATTAKNEQARIAAAKELLDRGYGKATQPLANDPENSLQQLPDKIEIRIVRPGPDEPVHETDEYLPKQCQEEREASPPIKTWHDSGRC